MVTADGFPHTGGVEKHIHMVSKNIVKLGHKVDVVFLSKTRIKAFTKDGVSYKPFKALLGNTHLFNINYIIQVLKNVEKYDIVHFQGLHKPLPVLMLSLLRNKKVGKVFTPHYHGGGHSMVADLAHTVYTPLVEPVLNQLDNVIAVSNFEKNVLQVSFPETHSKTHVVYNGVEVDNIMGEKTTNEDVNILFVSRLEKYKNIDKVLQHLPENSVVNIVGDGKYRQTLQEVAFANPKIVTVFHGRVSDEKLAKLWNEADVHINMSSKEAYGLTVVEALTHKTPVLCSNIPAFVEVKKLTKSRNIHIVDNVSDVKNLVKKITKKGFIEDSMVLPTWEDNASQTVVLYEKILGNYNETS